MKADDILKKHEDANEMHFHEVDRKWIIEAMEEYASLRQPTVIGSVCSCSKGKGIDHDEDGKAYCIDCGKYLEQTIP